MGKEQGRWRTMGECNWGVAEVGDRERTQRQGKSVVLTSPVARSHDVNTQSQTNTNLCKSDVVCLM